MKKLLFAIALIAMITGSSVFAKAKKPKQAAGRPELIDYKGQALGREIPKWVEAIADGDKASLKKAMKLDKDEMLFVLSRDGDNLDFLKVWVDQIDARVEVASSLETTIANAVETELSAQQVETEEVQRRAKLYSAQATNMTLNGLQKLNDYWIKTRTLKTGLKKGKKDEDYTYRTTYFVVFAMDKNVYDEQLQAAMNNVDDDNDQTETLRNLLTVKCSDALMPTSESAKFDYDD